MPHKDEKLLELERSIEKMQRETELTFSVMKDKKKNQDLYAYMHDIFGADVIELFDMKYNPEENRPKPAKKEKKKKKKD